VTSQTSYRDRERLSELWRIETETFRVARPKSEMLWRKATPHLPDGVPMLWMAKWPGPWPVYVERAQGAHFECVDGIDHVDLCLGDTGAMCGHAPTASVRAISEQLAKGSTFMLPTADAAAAAELLTERFGVPSWQFTLSATDANRSLIRYARQVTGRPKIVVPSPLWMPTVLSSSAVATSAPRFHPLRRQLSYRSTMCLHSRRRWRAARLPLCLSNPLSPTLA
jgi:glutamate-1-semialdehyde 2,1-aminomutase